MSQPSLGIHHITAIASKPQENIDFYTKLLGLRLVKRSVNQDQVEAYHLFFGDKTGEPGMDLTFFTFDPVVAGHNGPGLVTNISFAVHENAFDFWQKRLADHDIALAKPETRFGFKRLSFRDHDGQQLELVAVDDNTFDLAKAELWTTSEIALEQAIGYFHSARLSVVSKTSMDLILTRILGFQVQDQEESVTLYQNSASPRASFIEVEEHPGADMGQSGAGTVHHIAFQVKDQEHLESLREEILRLGLYPTEVIDRFYFKSVYFRTPSGILFELATNGPGFAVDEPEETLGQTLKLPPWLEPHRKHIEAGLEEIKL